MFVPTQGIRHAIRVVGSKTPDFSLQVNRHDLTLTYADFSPSDYSYLALEPCRSNSFSEPVCQYYLKVQINQKWLYASYTKTTQDHFNQKFIPDGFMHFRPMDDTVLHPFKEFLRLSVRSNPTDTKKSTLSLSQSFYLCFNNPLLNCQMCFVGSDVKITTNPTNCELQIAS